MTKKKGGEKKSSWKRQPFQGANDEGREKTRQRGEEYPELLLGRSPPQWKDKHLLWEERRRMVEERNRDNEKKEARRENLKKGILGIRNECSLTL